MQEMYHDTGKYGYKVLFDEQASLFTWERNGRTGTALSLEEAVLTAFDPDFREIIGKKMAAGLEKYGGHFEDAMQDARIRVMKTVRQRGFCTGSFLIQAAIWGAGKMTERVSFGHEVQAQSTTLYEEPETPDAVRLHTPDALTDHGQEQEISAILATLPEDMQELARLYVQGWTQSDLIKQYGRSVRTKTEQLRAILLPILKPELAFQANKQAMTAC